MQKLPSSTGLYHAPTGKKTIPGITSELLITPARHLPLLLKISTMSPSFRFRKSASLGLIFTGSLPLILNF